MNNSPQPIPSPRPPTWLIVLSVLLVLFHVDSVINALRLSPEIAKTLSFSRGVQVITGCLWALIFGQATFSLLQCKSSAVNRALCWMAVFIVYSTLRLLLFAQSDYDRHRLPFLLALTAILALSLISGYVLHEWLRRYHAGKTNRQRGDTNDR